MVLVFLSRQQYLALSILCFVLHFSDVSFSQESEVDTYRYAKKRIECDNGSLRSDNLNREYSSRETQLVKKYINKGYLACSIDSISQRNGECELFIYKGQRYRLAAYSLLPNSLFRVSKDYLFKPKLTPSFIDRVDRHVLTNIIDDGYPNAQLSREVTFENGWGYMSYEVNAKQRVFFDSITCSPSGIVTYNYLSQKTGIECGSPFTETAIKNISKNINKERLFSIDSIYTIIRGGRAKVVLKVKKINLNSFSGLIGLQTNKDEKAEVTGDVSIHLVNAFKQGEKVSFEWQKPGEESQRLKVNLIIPYLFRLPIGLSVYGDFDKQDSLFTNTKLKAGLLIPTVNYGELSINTKLLNSSVGVVESTYLSSTKSVLYGVGYTFSHIDNPRVVRRGFSLKTELYVGVNTSLDYDSNPTNMVLEWVLNDHLVLPLPIGGLSLRNECGITLNDSIMLNNLYRVGGVRSIRGFNERSIYSRAYTFANVEYHLYVNAMSYFFILYDIGVFSEPSVEFEFFNTVRQSTGMGISVFTKAGRLTVSYAIGKRTGGGFNINNGQVHIGYVNLF